eukprot:317235-Chlamydomonas_euryale.AAC.1
MVGCRGAGWEWRCCWHAHGGSPGARAGTALLRVPGGPPAGFEGTGRQRATLWRCMFLRRDGACIFCGAVHVFAAALCMYSRQRGECVCGAVHVFAAALCMYSRQHGECVCGGAVNVFAAARC